MGLFGKTKKRELSPFFLDEEMEISPAVNYNSVLEWLVGLSDEDYQKVGKIANIYRNADDDACKALGVPNEAVTFINPPEPPQDSVLDPATSDDIAESLLDDLPPQKVKIVKKPKQ